jgi:hypothetical protein
MDRRAAPVLALALVLLGPALAGLAPAVGGAITPEVSFTGVRDYAVDLNNDTLYEEFVVEVHLDVTVAGSYTVVCYMTYEEGGATRNVAYDYVDTVLVQGNNTVDVTFDSEPIYASTHTGPFMLDIVVTKIDYFTPWGTTKSTAFYDYRDFASVDNPPPVPPDAPRVELDVNYVNVTTTVFQVFVNRTSPEIVYRYRELRPGLPDFVVRFTRLLFYGDDGDGYYDGEDIVAAVELGNFPWALTNIQVAGAQATFDLKSRLPVQVGAEFHPVNVTFGFLVTNGSGALPDGWGFIHGQAAELKVNILVDLSEGVPGADAVAFEAKASDTLHNHDYLVEEPTGFRLFPSRNSTAYLPVPSLPGRDATVVGIVDGNLVQHAFVGWLVRARQHHGDPDVTVEVPVGASMRINQGRLELMLSYAYAPDVLAISHDPSVGVLTENLPPLPPTPPPPEQEQPNFYVWALAIIVGAAILVLSVYARAKGY